MDITQFMRGYKAAWEARDESRFCALFTSDGIYRNTPFSEQRGHEQLRQYWQRVKLQADINVTFEILASSSSSGLAHWHVTYQVTSEELFQIWAASTGTNVVTRKPGDPLPRMALDGILQAQFDRGLCSECRIWWHSMALVQREAKNADT
jgi:limonene-1,2-epoxide hydrolase